MKVAVLLLVLVAAGLAGPPLRHAEADPGDLYFDVLVHSSYVPAPQIQVARVNGALCGSGVVDGYGQGEFIAIFLVPASCATPGAEVRFFVDGYMLKDTVGWGVSGNTFTFVTTTFAHSPAGLYGGWAFGVSDGATVEARVDGVVCGTTTAIQLGRQTRVPLARYMVRVKPATMPPEGKAGCGFPGAQVHFFVNGVEVTQSAWSPGLHLLNLSP